jgi:hypothetical protein
MGGRLIYWCKQGAIHIRCLDDKGRVEGGADGTMPEVRQRVLLDAYQQATGMAPEKLPGNPGGLRRAPEAQRAATTGEESD